MINNEKPPLNMTCRVFKSPTLEAALTEAAAKGYKTDDGYWWANHLYLPVEQTISKPITEDEEY